MSIIKAFLENRPVYSSTGIVDVDCPIRLDDVTAPVRRLPLQGVTGRPFIAEALPDKAPELGIASDSFASLHGVGPISLSIPPVLNEDYAAANLT